MKGKTYFSLTIFILILLNGIAAPAKKPAFRVMAFYSGKNDLAHVSFVNEANQWFSEQGEKHNFVYHYSNDWSKMTIEFLSGYDVVIFLDARPDSLPRRMAFQYFMEHGGAWMGFHFCAFALTPSGFPQNWDWYHVEFLGSGQYKSNTWRPTSAVLKVENKKHPAMKKLPAAFLASPNEWYRWENDLRENPDIEILAAIDAASFPLGTGPKPHEIWQTGYYPVVWTNKKYKMIYINMGHNDIDYEGNTNRELSFTFENKMQNTMILNALFWLAGSKKKR